MEHNIGEILNSIIVDNPKFFKNFTNETEDNSIMSFIEIVDEYKHIIRLKETEIKLPEGIINQLKKHFQIL